MQILYDLVAVKTEFSYHTPLVTLGRLMKALMFQSEDLPLNYTVSHEELAKTAHIHTIFMCNPRPPFAKMQKDFLVYGFFAIV